MPKVVISNVITEKQSEIFRKEEIHQPPHTIDGEIASTLRSYEISGLFKDHCYR